MSPVNAKTTIGQPFIELTTVDSTNIYAMDHLQANLAAHGAAFFTHTQLAGKGQHGKKWESAPGANIVMSVIVDCSFLSLTKQFYLSIMVSLACYDFFSSYAPDETSIKWPNDIYWRDRKAGGVLIETILRGNKWQGAVVGIGININQTSFSIQGLHPVSLQQITGKQFNCIDLAKELCACLEKRYQQLKKRRFSELLVEYNTYLYKRKQEVKLKYGPIVFTGVIKGVSATGELLVLNGLKDSFRFGEVEWVVDRLN